MLKWAFVGGLNDESRTKSVFAGIAGAVEWINWNEDVEAVKDERVERRVGRSEVISVNSEEGEQEGPAMAGLVG